MLSQLILADGLQVLAAGVVGAGWGSRKSGKSSAFSLFNLKAKNKFWNEAVIHGGKHLDGLAFSLSLEDIHMR